MVKAVLTWPQLVMDAILLFKNSRALPQCLRSSPQPQETTTHPPGRAKGLVETQQKDQSFVS